MRVDDAATFIRSKTVPGVLLSYIYQLFLETVFWLAS